MLTLKRKGKRQAARDRDVYDSLIDFITQYNQENHPAVLHQVVITREEADSLYRHTLRHFGTAPMFRAKAEGLRNGTRRLKGVKLIIED